MQELNIHEVGAGVEPRLPLEAEPVRVKADLCILQVYNVYSISNRGQIIKRNCDKSLCYSQSPVLRILPPPHLSKSGL